MSRALLTFLIALPLLMPAGFCPCHLAEGGDVCADDDNATGDDSHDDDPTCPCKNVDAGIRGFRSHDAVEIVGPIAAPVLLNAIVFDRFEDIRANRDDIPLFTSAPRYLVFLALLT